MTKYTISNSQATMVVNMTNKTACFLSLVLALGSAGISSAVKFPDTRKLSPGDGNDDNDHNTDQIEIEFEPIAFASGGIEGYTQQILISTGCSSCTRTFPESGKYEEKHRAAGLHLFHTCDCEAAAPPGHSKGRGAKQAVSRLETTVNTYGNVFELSAVSFVPEIQQAVVPGSDQPILEARTAKKQSNDFVSGISAGHPVRGRFLASGSNDPMLKIQTHYDVVGLSQAWNVLTQEGAWSNAQNVVVQVVDSGWDLSHVDLGGNAWLNPGESCSAGGIGKDDDNNGYVDDCYGYNHADQKGGTNLLGSSDHGSHCSGTISADTDNSIGVAGVAGGLGGGNVKGVSIMASVAFSQRNSGGFAEALIYGADNGAHISSNSWGYSDPNVFPGSVKSAIDYAVAAGVVVVFAAGNDGKDEHRYPAYYDKVIAVAATDNNKKAASFTNFGSWVDIAAPGVQVASTSNNNTYAYKSGTSMACPHIAGILGLGKTLNPSATSSDLKNCLFSTAANIDSLQQQKYVGKLGAGMVDAPAFLNCVRNVAQGPATPKCPDASQQCGASSTCQDFGFAVPGGMAVCLPNGCVDSSGCYKIRESRTSLSGAQNSEIRGMVLINYPTKYISFRLSGGTGDADLYVGIGRAPTTTQFDCRPYVSSNEEICEAIDNSWNNPQGVFHYMVRGYNWFSGVTLQVITDGDPGVGTPNLIKAPTSKPTPKPTTMPTSRPSASPSSKPSFAPTSAPVGRPGQGSCADSGKPCSVSSTCVDLGFLGGTLQCSSPTSANVCGCHKLVYEEEGLSAVKDATIRRQILIDHPTGYLLIQIQGGSGDADLYVGVNSAPNEDQYACRPYLSGNIESCINMNDSQAATYHVMIRAFSTFSGVALRVVTDGDAQHLSSSGCGWLCKIGGTERRCSGCPSCEAAVCTADSFCCRETWDSMCARAATTMCSGM